MNKKYLRSFLLLSLLFPLIISAKTTPKTALQKAEISLPKQCLFYFKMFLHDKEPKAFSYAIDSKEKVTCRYSSASKNQKRADEVALASCQKSAKAKGIKNQCKLYKLNENIAKTQAQVKFEEKYLIKDKTPIKSKPITKNNHTQYSSALKKAILSADLKKIKILIKKGADIDTQASDKSRALFVAVAKGDISYAKELIKKGAFVFIKKRDGNNLLVAAIMSGSNRMLRLMLEQKINPNIRCEDGNTPLHFAFMMFDDKMIKSLYTFGSRDDIKNSKGKSVKDLAKEFHINLKRMK